MIILILRTGFEAAAASHATRISVALLHFFLGHARTGTQIVSPIQFNPGMDLLQVIKHTRAVDNEIANIGKLRHGLELDGLFEVVDKRRARLAGATIDYYGANATKLLQTVYVANWGGRGVFSLVNW